MENRTIEVKAFECNQCLEFLPLFESGESQMVLPDEGMTCELCLIEHETSQLDHVDINYMTREKYTDAQIQNRKELASELKNEIIKILKRRLTYK